MSKGAGKAGWQIKRLDEVCEISSTLVDPRDDEYLNMVHVGGANIESKTGELIKLKTARDEALISPKFIFDETAVLYSKIRPYLMKVARPDFRGLCSADVYPLSAKGDLLSRDYLFYLLLSREFTEYATGGSARAGTPLTINPTKHLLSFHRRKPLHIGLEPLSVVLLKVEGASFCSGSTKIGFVSHFSRRRLSARIPDCGQFPFVPHYLVVLY